MKKTTPFYFVIFLILILSPLSSGVDIPGKVFPVDVDKGQVLLAYEGTHELFYEDKNVERIVLTINSASARPVRDFNRMKNVIKGYPSQVKKTLILSPLLARKTKLGEHAKTMLCWNRHPFLASKWGKFNGETIFASSYEVIDRFLEKLVLSNNFPNLKTIILVGFEGGGELINHYAASGYFAYKIAAPHNIEMRYIAMAPCSFLYFNKERAVDGTVDQFEIPKNPPENFNKWGIGLDELQNYHYKHKITPKGITLHYKRQKILYLVGQNDTDEDCWGLGNGESSNRLMGESYFERLEIYHNYLIKFYGEEIKQNQFFRIQKNVGHDEKKLLYSNDVKYFIFMPNNYEKVDFKTAVK